jgi:acetylornithine deacetylase/succinyl-diaminopimelate desuccinylase-like protein
MSSRDHAISSALAFFDAGGFRDRLAALVAIPSTMQDPAFEKDVWRYLKEAIEPWVTRMGFKATIHPNPREGFGPIMVAERIEDPSYRTVLTYGHGDTVRGLDDQWDEGLKPWEMKEVGDRWYGRGTADNKGQHATHLTALEHVLAARGGKLGFNLKLVLEMSEERGSTGLKEFVASHAKELAADVLIASDGPRVAAPIPTVTTGTRGSWGCDLSVRLRPGGVHSGNWGGMIVDPVVVLSHALASICDRNGKILVRDWLPQNGLPAQVRGALAGLELPSEESATIDPNWGEPGFTSAEKVFGWTSFIVLAMIAGRPEAPVNAVAPWASANIQLRYTVDSDVAGFEAALRRHLDAAGFPEVQIENPKIGMPASRTDLSNPWVGWTVTSMEKSLGKRVQVIPNGGGGLPGDVFVDHLGVPLVWIPLSYNGCKQHGPNEHFLIAPAREGLAAYAGLWWDLGEPGVP